MIAIRIVSLTYGLSVGSDDTPAELGDELTGDANLGFAEGDPLLDQCVFFRVGAEEGRVGSQGGNCEKERA